MNHQHLTSKLQHVTGTVRHGIGTLRHTINTIQTALRRDPNQEPILHPFAWAVITVNTAIIAATLTTFSAWTDDIKDDLLRQAAGHHRIHLTNEQVHALRNGDTITVRHQRTDTRLRATITHPLRPNAEAVLTRADGTPIR